jgi:cytochrome oxidase Cu insertion factor (SCO1/SenC/PrrC family)
VSLRGALRKWRAAALTAVVIAASAGAYLYVRPDAPKEGRRADAARLMGELMSGKGPVGGPFTLSDSNGERRGLADFRGKLVLLYFGFAYCPDICPTDLMAIGNLIRSLGEDADKLQPVFITLDPERDTREVLRAYVASFHPRFVALTGTEEEIRRVATSYKVYFEKVRVPGVASYVIDHAAYVFLLDREGRFVTLFPPGTSAERMAIMVREQLTVQ